VGLVKKQIRTFWVMVAARCRETDHHKRTVTVIVQQHALLLVNILAMLARIQMK
jgi:hypothetical protein